MGELRHVPATHSVPSRQRVPHAPQFAGSRAVSTQTPQSAIEQGAHVPATHTPEAHQVPHAPQFSASELVSTPHTPEQVVPIHGRQRPATQYRLPQTFPQTPQLSGSLLVSPHAVEAPAQIPFEHVWPGPHTRSQSPQWSSSSRRSKHPVAQLVCVPSQEQMPPRQRSPATHVRPHDPQWDVLVRRSTHSPLQSVSGGSHVHPRPGAHEQPLTVQLERPVHVGEQLEAGVVLAQTGPHVR